MNEKRSDAEWRAQDRAIEVEKAALQILAGFASGEGADMDEPADVVRGAFEWAEVYVDEAQRRRATAVAGEQR